MPSLADILLSGGSPVRARTSAQPAWRSRLAEAVQTRRPIQFSFDEARVLTRILEQYEADPFKGGPTDFMQADDMAAIGLTALEAGGSEGSSTHEEPAQPAARAASGLISVENAIVAPSATPGGHEDIPASVISTLAVLHSDDEAKPVTDIPNAKPVTDIPNAKPPVERAPVAHHRAPAPPASGEGPIPSGLPKPGLSPEDEAEVVESIRLDREQAIQRTLMERMGGGSARINLQEAAAFAESTSDGVPHPVDFVRKFRKSKQKLTEGRPPQRGGGATPPRRRPTGGSNVLDVPGASTTPANTAALVQRAQERAGALGFDDPDDQARF